MNSAASPLDVLTGPLPRVGSSAHSKRVPSAMETIAKKLKQHTLPLFNDPTDPHYTDSFGERLDDLDDKSRWLLAGFALQVWKDTLFPLLGEVMENRKRDIYRGEHLADYHVMALCYMLGCDQAHAHPTIVVACDGKRFKPILKRALKVLHRVGDFAQRGFKLLGIRDPDLKFRGGITGCPVEIVNLIADQATPGPVTLCGREILVSHTDRLATIGGTIVIDGDYYALTVAHPFVETSHAVDANRHDTGVELFTMEWALDSDDDEDGDDDDDEDEDEVNDGDSAYDSGDELSSGSSNDMETAGMTSMLTLRLHLKGSDAFITQKLPLVLPLL